VQDAWKVLVEAGVPLGPVRAPRSKLGSPAALQAAVAEAMASADPGEIEALTAWLSVFRQHYPTRFHEMLGPAADESTDRLRLEIRDPARYLKLRRIALENLSHASS
jgi:hypothetical protein